MIFARVAMSNTTGNYMMDSVFVSKDISNKNKINKYVKNAIIIKESVILIALEIQF